MKSEKEINDAVNALWKIDPQARDSAIITVRETLEWTLGDTSIVDDILSDYEEVKSKEIP